MEDQLCIFDYLEELNMNTCNWKEMAIPIGEYLFPSCYFPKTTYINNDHKHPNYFFDELVDHAYFKKNIGYLRLV